MMRSVTRQLDRQDATTPRGGSRSGRVETPKAPAKALSGAAESQPSMVAQGIATYSSATSRSQESAPTAFVAIGGHIAILSAADANQGGLPEFLINPVPAINSVRW